MAVAIFTNRSDSAERSVIGTNPEDTMGKGDQRTRKGKIYRGTSGKTRPANGKKRDHAAEAKSTR